MAAIVELLVHSHVPGTIALLPSLPSAFAAQPGHVYGLQARGDVLVSLEWAIGGSLVAAQLVFQSAHPWQVALEAHPQYSSRGGFYHSAPRTPSNAQVSLSLKVSAPNKLSIASLLQSEIDTCSVELLPGSTSEGKMGSAEHQIVFGDVSKYPCVVSLCGANVDAAHCTAAQNLMSAHLAFSSSGF